MPYSSIEAAKEAGFPTTAEGAAMTMAQVNKLASIYDAVKAGGQVENAMAVAWTQWKKMFKKEGDKWVKKESATSAILTSAIGKSDWIPVAVPGQQTTLSMTAGDITLTISEEALNNHLESWSGGYINVNHEDGGEIGELKIESAKFEDGKLWHKVSPEVAAFIRNMAASGRSIEIKPLKIVNNQVMEFEGLGLSVLFPPFKPACSPEMGCSSQSGGDNIDSNKTLIQKIESVLRSFKSNEEQGAGGTTAEQKPPELEDKMTNEEIDKLTSALKEANTSRDEAMKEIETLKSSLGTMGEQLKAYQDAEAEAKAKLKEDQWAVLKSSIPPGLTHKPEDEAELKKSFMEDPAAFAVKMASWKMETPKGESGKSYTPDLSDDQDARDYKELESMLTGIVK